MSLCCLFFSQPVICFIGENVAFSHHCITKFFFFFLSVPEFLAVSVLEIDCCLVEVMSLVSRITVPLTVVVCRVAMETSMETTSFLLKIGSHLSQ